MIPFGSVQMVGSQCGSVAHVAKIQAGRDYNLVLQQQEPLLLALHFHRGKSVICLGGEAECNVCFSEGTDPRWYAFWACQEIIHVDSAPWSLGRRAVIQVPYMTYAFLSRKLANCGDSADHAGLVVRFRRAKSIRSPVHVTILRRTSIDASLVVSTDATFNVVLKWLGLSSFNGDQEAWKLRVKKLIASDDFYSSQF